MNTNGLNVGDYVKSKTERTFYTDSYGLRKTKGRTRITIAGFVEAPNGSVIAYGEKPDEFESVNNLELD